MKLREPLSSVGVVAGVVFFAFSLAPSLVPRPFPFQAGVSGLSLALGYALGCTGRWLWSYLELPFPSTRVGRALTSTAAIVAFATTATFVWHAAAWQNSVRALMGMEEVGGVRLVRVTVLALLVFTALLGLARLCRAAFLLLSQHLHLYLPRRLANAGGIVVAVVVFWGIIDGVVVSALLRVADRVSQQVDAIVQDDLERPEGPARTGGRSSLIAWSDLGRQGRLFVTSGPTLDDLRAFHGAGADVREPIRVYVGLNAADTPEARARLALQELERVDAFERSVLLLVTPTGTGWIDPAALDSVEYLLRGDVATVAAQYSYLPSVLALTVEGAYGAEAAQALFDAVYGHWTRLPRDTRPALYLHGVSLGSLNSEQSFDLHDILADPFDGALWSGPSFRSESWKGLTAGRRPGSPSWLPRYRNGFVVRFMNQDGGLDDPGPDWGPHRIAYLQYASDPMTFFSPRSFYREPEWMRGPRGPDVSPALRWFPAVTMVQLAADMAVAKTTPPGYGHNFAAAHYIDAWMGLLEPDGWTADGVTRLKALLAARLESDGWPEHPRPSSGSRDGPPEDRGRPSGEVEDDSRHVPGEPAIHRRLASR